MAGALVTVVAALGLRHFVDSPFEYDFRKLSTDSDHDENYRSSIATWTPCSAPGIRPPCCWPTGWTRSSHAAGASAGRTGPASPYIGRVVTIYDVLPGTAPSSAQKLQLLADIRKLASDPAIDLLDEKDRQSLRENLPPADLRELRPEDLPPLARRPFTERDGSVGRALLATTTRPRSRCGTGTTCWASPACSGGCRCPTVSVIESSGPPMIFGGMLRSILRDGPLATGLSLLGVVLVLALFVRPLRAGAAGAGRAAAGRVLDGGRGRAPGRAHQLPQLHRPAHHLRHRRRIRGQRGGPSARRGSTRGVAACWPLGVRSRSAR